MPLFDGHNDDANRAFAALGAAALCAIALDAQVEIIMFRFLFGETQSKIADRLDRHGDRYHNAGDLLNESMAREAAERARNASTLDEARWIEREFNQTHQTRGRDDS